MTRPIPRLIHQMWGSSDVPAPYSDYHRRIRELNPDCEVFLWTDRALDEFVETAFPHRFDAFRALPLDVHRWDLARYMLLRQHGGLYVDMDIEPTRSFSPLFDGDAGLALFHEHPDDVKRMRRHWILANAVIGCAPGPSLMDTLIDEICSLRRIDATRTGVCEQTGPILLTSVYGRHRPPAVLHDHRAFFPNAKAFDGSTGSQAGRFGTHRFAATWWKQVLPPR